MKKIYAKTLNPEYFDYRVYDIREDEGNKIIVDGGRDFINVDNNGELDILKKLIDNFGGYEWECYYRYSIKEYLSDYLYPLKKDNGKKLSPRELHEIKVALESWNSYTYMSEYEEHAIVVILSILHCEPYTSGAIRGYCQGDYAKIYMPENTSQKEIDYVEAWFFGTGTEIEIDDTGRQNIESPDEIEGYTILTTEWKDEDLIEEIKKQFKEKVEVVLWKYSNTRTIKIDEYELAG